MRKDIVDLVALEARYQIDLKILERLLAGGQVISLNKYEALIDAGEYCPDVFVVGEGIVRATYTDKNAEMTIGFALPGTLLFSFHCFYGEVPSFLRFEACCKTEVIRIPRKSFDSLIAESHEFAIWVMSANQNQLYYNECRMDLISGDAKERVKSLLRRWSALYPDIPSYAITSNFDVPESHSRKMHRELTERWRNIIPTVPSRVIASYLGITEQHLSKIKREILLERRSKKRKDLKS